MDIENFVIPSQSPLKVYDDLEKKLGNKEENKEEKKEMKEEKKIHKPPTLLRVPQSVASGSTTIYSPQIAPKKPVSKPASPIVLSRSANIYRNPYDFKHGLCGCLKDTESCLCGSFCYPSQVCTHKRNISYSGNISYLGKISNSGNIS